VFDSPAQAYNIFRITHSFGVQAMSREIKESDWKVFKELHAIALDRYFERAIAEIDGALRKKDETDRERFWNTVKLADERRKEVAKLFDDYRRSTALFQLAAIRSQKLLTDEEMSRFSAECREIVDLYLR
jgi:hypothetical protein